jgi:hypothetical protein
MEQDASTGALLFGRRAYGAITAVQGIPAAVLCGTRIAGRRLAL